MTAILFLIFGGFALFIFIKFILPHLGRDGDGPIIGINNDQEKASSKDSLTEVERWEQWDD